MADSSGTAQGDAASSPSKLQKKATALAALQLLAKMVEALQWGQREKAIEVGRQVALALDDVQPALATRLRRLSEGQMRPVPMGKPDDLIDFADARHGLDAVILPAQVEAACREIIKEHARRAALADYGLNPRHKVLLHGFPGNGKTMLAEALAFELEVPFLSVKYGGLIESYLGSSGKNLQKTFDYASTAPCVLFMDEFDGVGMARDDNRDVGEMRRMTNQLLILIEKLPSSCMLVAATNAENLLDPALLRRFDFIIDVPQPTHELVLRCARRELDPAITPGHDVLRLADQVAARAWENLSAVVGLCRSIRRDLVLNGGAGGAALARGDEPHPACAAAAP